MPRGLSFDFVQDPSFRFRACGRVAEVRPPDAPDVWTTVVIDGEGPESARSIRMTVPENAPLPFGVGDAISVSITASRLGAGTTASMWITDDAGQLLVGARSAPGWSFEVGPVRGRGRVGGDAGHLLHAVDLGHLGRTVRINPGDGWKRVEMCDGDWLVAGGATSLAPGNRRRDDGPTQGFVVYRVVREP